MRVPKAHYPLLLTLSLLTACGGEEPSPEPTDDDAEAAATGPAPASTGTDIWLAPVLEGEGGVVEIGEPRNLTDRAGYDNQPHFLADGDLLFTREEGGNTDIWRWDAETDAISRVTETAPESEYSPTPLPGSSGFSAVRVEADSTQRLWRFDEEGDDASPILADIAPVGYHAWVTPDTVALFVLGDPPTLQLASVATGTGTVLAENIGRSLQPVPGRHAFSYAQRQDDGTTMLRVHDVATGEATEAGPGVDGQDFHAWTPSGVLLQASGSRVFFWHSTMGHFMPAADFSTEGLQISRLAVSGDGQWIALVADRPAG